jgi:putative transcriptional regulator
MHLDIDFFKFQHHKVLPKQGRILISEPFLNDSYFKRSVVLLTEHDHSGSAGFILNKPLEVPAKEVIKNFPVNNVKVGVGGPVDTENVHYLHTFKGVPGAYKVTNNVYWGGNFDFINQLISAHDNPEKHIRFFIGYSGWDKGQLNDELSSNAWIVHEIPTSIIMNENDPRAWEKILNKMGDQYRIWVNSPVNPNMN